jgi:hypothetical protein
MENKSKYSDIVKTDKFFIGKKSEKSSFIENQKNIEFSRILKFIKKSERSKNQFEERLRKRSDKRDFLFLFEIVDDDVRLTKLSKYKDQSEVTLQNSQYYFRDESKGFFRGSELDANILVQELTKNKR